MTKHASPPVPRRSVTPSQLPLREKAALFERLRRARQQQPPSSWQQLEIEEGYAQRTLEHFYRSAMKLEKHADRRPQAEIVDERAGRFYPRSIDGDAAQSPLELGAGGVGGRPRRDRGCTRSFPASCAS